MCDKTVDACLRALKLVPDWFVSNKMLEKLDDVVFSNDDIVFVNENSDNVKFLVMIWPLTLYTLIILLLMMIILMMMFLKLLSVLYFWFSAIYTNNARHNQKVMMERKYIIKKLMTVAWHPTIWWDSCMSDDEKMK